jgi:hypothetical protein
MRASKEFEIGKLGTPNLINNLEEQRRFFAGTKRNSRTARSLRPAVPQPHFPRFVGFFVGTKTHRHSHPSCRHLCADADQTNHSTLRFAFLCRDCLCICVHRDPAGGVPEQFLHDLDVRPVCPQKGRIRVTKGVPPNVFGDSQLSRDRSYGSAHDFLSPIRLSALHSGVGKNPVLRPVVSHMFKPCPQRFRQIWIEPR